MLDCVRIDLYILLSRRVNHPLVVACRHTVVIGFDKSNRVTGVSGGRISGNNCLLY